MNIIKIFAVFFYKYLFQFTDKIAEITGPFYVVSIIISPLFIISFGILNEFVACWKYFFYALGIWGLIAILLTIISYINENFLLSLYVNIMRGYNDECPKCHRWWAMKGHFSKILEEGKIYRSRTITIWPGDPHDMPHQTTGEYCEFYTMGEVTYECKHCHYQETKLRLNSSDMSDNYFKTTEFDPSRLPENRMILKSSSKLDINTD